MLRNLLHFGERDADDVAIPRGEIIAVSADASWDELVALFAEHGVSRMPVYRDTLDDIVGMMHIKDVFARLAADEPPPAIWTELLREPLYVPQARSALDVLADMRARRIHLAVVVDEFSGTDGIITFEDLVEEIIGEIEDEHDEEPVDLVVQVADDVWEADARAELDDVAEIVDDPRIAEVAEAVDTLGGLAFVLAEQVPQPGAVLTHPSGWTIEVVDGDETHVTRLRLTRPPPALDEGETELG
jgi:CBS domain containing-hemolysin-like protein